MLKKLVFWMLLTLGVISAIMAQAKETDYYQLMSQNVPATCSYHMDGYSLSIDVVDGEYRIRLTNERNPESIFTARDEHNYVVTRDGVEFDDNAGYVVGYFKNLSTEYHSWVLMLSRRAMGIHEAEMFLYEKKDPISLGKK